jgi:hypothetical protein
LIKEKQIKVKYIDDQDAACHMIYKQYIRGALRRGFTFELEYDIFKASLHKPCIYCGRTDTNNTIYAGRKYLYKYNGLDRIDNTIGYTFDNTQTVCGQCNRAKGTLSKLAFEEWIAAIVQYQNTK